MALAALLSVAIVAFGIEIRIAALICLPVYLARSPSSVVSKLAGLLLGLLVWSFLPWIHPTVPAAALIGVASLSFIRSRLVFYSALGSLLLAGSAVLPQLLQDPGPSFAAYLRARPALLDAYFPTTLVANPRDPAGWIWRETPEGEFFLSTSEGWVSDGGRLIQNPSIRVLRAALDSARELDGPDARVEFKGFLTRDFCNAFLKELRSGVIHASQPTPFARTPHCESEASIDQQAPPPSIQIFIEPFATGSTESAGPERTRWTCGTRRWTAQHQVRFRQVYCRIDGTRLQIRRLMDSPAIKRAKLLWPMEMEAQ